MQKSALSLQKETAVNGIENVTVAEVMKDAGLTHGAFYAHFGSKGTGLELIAPQHEVDAAGAAVPMIMAVKDDRKRRTPMSACTGVEQHGDRRS